MPRNDDIEVAFAEPWHAQLFAISHTLASSGHFAWSDWIDHFAAALTFAEDTNMPSDGSAYYDIWLNAFEDFMVLRGLADTTGLAGLKSDWTDAYLSTPHGEPVEL